ncbi:MAG: transporter substrate-binding domain-containing protein [Amylibacter sp.]|jgi:polar amino acid transport system substrate-binding protein|tara:strand:+ start:8783 stop:9463 length:681 start_codon:yes stop_codon:yes gene_type:complete
MQNSLKKICKNGTLRVAYNIGNQALIQSVDNSYLGVSPALAQRLANEIDAQIIPIIYESAGNVLSDTVSNAWDVGFLAINKPRAEKVTFTNPYSTIDITYAVHANSSLYHTKDIDRKGINIVTSSGSAYEIYLNKTLKNAKLKYSGTPFESFFEFQVGSYDAVVGVRASLEQYFNENKNIRILHGTLTSVKQAMVLPIHNNPRIAALNIFLDNAVADGFFNPYTNI